MIPVVEMKRRDDLVAGIAEGLEDFIEGRCKHFKTDEEIEAYLMSL
jgi:predicted transcriptional regulator